MTSTVKVTAHCASTKEVHVEIAGIKAIEKYTLQDGESKEFYVYDNRIVVVNEFDKPVAETTAD